MTGPEGHPPNLEMETNLAAQVDRLLLGAHVWRTAGTWDPEGVLSTFPAIATAWLVFPINKSVWTPSFVLLTAGLASASFAVIYWAVDVVGWRKWVQPFVTYGKNAIAVYVGAGLLARTLGAIRWAGADGLKRSLWERLYQTLYASWLPCQDASLAWALSMVLLFYLMAYWMDRRGIYLKV